MKLLLLRADKRAVAMFNGIARKVSVARRLDGRINNLWLFHHGDKKASQPEWSDHPDVQLLLHMRDRLWAIQQNIRDSEKVIDAAAAEPKDRVLALTAQARLRTEESLCLKQMSDKLDTLRSESTRHWAMVAKMLGDLAKLRQNDAHFQKQLQLKQADIDGLTEDERRVIEAAAPKEDDEHAE